MFGFGPKTVTVDELAERLTSGKPVLIDVREPDEFARGHVPGARNIPLQTLVKSLSDLPRNRDLVVHCRNPLRRLQVRPALWRVTRCEHSLSFAGAKIATLLRKSCNSLPPRGKGAAASRSFARIVGGILGGCE